MQTVNHKWQVNDRHSRWRRKLHRKLHSYIVLEWNALLIVQWNVYFQSTFSTLAESTLDDDWLRWLRFTVHPLKYCRVPSSVGYWGVQSKDRTFSDHSPLYRCSAGDQSAKRSCLQVSAPFIRDLNKLISSARIAISKTSVFYIGNAVGRSKSLSDVRLTSSPSYLED